MFGLIAILGYAFFKFGWSYRLFNYCSILIGAVPMHREGVDHGNEMKIAVQRAAAMNILAGKHFNAGLRGIFFSSAISAGSSARSPSPSPPACCSRC